MEISNIICTAGATPGRDRSLQMHCRAPAAATAALQADLWHTRHGWHGAGPQNHMDSEWCLSGPSLISPCLPNQLGDCLDSNQKVEPLNSVAAEAVWGSAKPSQGCASQRRHEGKIDHRKCPTNFTDPQDRSRIILNHLPSSVLGTLGS